MNVPARSGKAGQARLGRGFHRARRRMSIRLCQGLAQFYQYLTWNVARWFPLRDPSDVPTRLRELTEGRALKRLRGRRRRCRHLLNCCPGRGAVYALAAASDY